MKKILALCLLAVLTTTAIAQPTVTPMPRPDRSTITVTGSSEVSVIPDQSVVNIHLSSTKMNMSDATKTLGDQSKNYTNILKELGFKESDIKTTNFSVSKNRFYRDNKYIDSGYVASQDLTVTFNYTEVLLQKIAARFSASKDPVDFSISFQVSDKLSEQTEATLIEKAVTDARTKATALSNAARVKLSDIKSIVYGTDIQPPVHYDMRMSVAAAPGAYDGENLSFAPQEVKLQQSVTIVWIIE